MKWQSAECRRGDIVRVKLGTIYHYGIFVSEDEVIQFGLPPTPQNLAENAGFTVCATDIDTFACGCLVERGIPSFAERLKRYSRKKTVRNARARLGEGGYNLIHNNCEHFVYLCAFGVKLSLQEEEARRRWNNRPVLDVYLAPVPDTLPTQPLYPKARNAEVMRCKAQTLQCAKYRAWQVLMLAAKKSFGLDGKKTKFKKAKNGKWLCKDFCFSITHTDKTVAVAVSKAAVGIDAEAVARKDRLLPLRAEMLTPAEKELYGDCDALSLLALWTKKEAVYKAEGGKAFAPADTESSRPDVATYLVGTDEECVLSVCSPYAERARFYLVDGDKVSPAQKERLQQK